MSSERSDHSDTVTTRIEASDETEPIQPVTAAAPRDIVPVAPQTKRSRAWITPALGFLTVAAYSGAHQLADGLPVNDLTRKDLAAAYPIPMQPAEWTWFVWPVVWALLAMYFVYAFLPRGRQRSRVNAVTPVYVLATAAGIGALLLAHYRNFRESLICAVVECALLLVIFVMLQRKEHAGASLSAVQRFMIAAPFSLALAWSAVHVMVALQRWQASGGWSGGPFGLRGWAVVLLMIGVLVSALIAFSTHEALFPLGIAVADIGIAQLQWGEDGLLTTIAIVMTMFNVLIAAGAFITAFDARSQQRQQLEVEAASGAAPRRRLRFWNTSGVSRNQ